MTTERTVPIYEVGDTFHKAPEDQKFFPRKSQAEKYAAQLKKDQLQPYVHEHRIELNRAGICHALNYLVIKN